MGLDVSVSCFVGYPIAFEQFFEKRTEVGLKCGNCKSYLDSGKKFCAECGNKFAPKSKTFFTQGAQNLLSYVSSYDPEDDVEDYDLEGIIFQDDVFSSYADKLTDPIIGVQLFSSDSHRSGGSQSSGISFQDLNKAIDEVIKRAKAFGKDITPADVKIYTSANMSY